MSDTTTTASEPLSSPESAQLNIDTSEPVNNNTINEAPQCTPVSAWRPLDSSDISDDVRKCMGRLGVAGMDSPLPERSPDINVMKDRHMPSAWIKVTDENGGLGAAMMHAMSGGMIPARTFGNIPTNVPPLLQHIETVSEPVADKDDSTINTK